jgi:hypothetical protein
MEKWKKALIAGGIAGALFLSYLIIFKPEIKIPIVEVPRKAVEVVIERIEVVWE